MSNSHSLAFLYPSFLFLFNVVFSFWTSFFCLLMLSISFHCNVRLSFGGEISSLFGLTHLSDLILPSWSFFFCLCFCSLWLFFCLRLPNLLNGVMAFSLELQFFLHGFSFSDFRSLYAPFFLLMLAIQTHGYNGNPFRIVFFFFFLELLWKLVKNEFQCH